MCLVSLLHRKAVEHHRTPKRKRNYRARNRGHVLECGSVLPLLSALVGLTSKTSLNTYEMRPYLKKNTRGNTFRGRFQFSSKLPPPLRLGSRGSSRLFLFVGRYRDRKSVVL